MITIFMISINMINETNPDMSVFADNNHLTSFIRLTSLLHFASPTPELPLVNSLKQHRQLDALISL